jgi:hypothetical protein
MQHMVASLEFSHSLDCHQIDRLFNNAQDPYVTVGATTDRAEIFFTKEKAALA